MAIVVSGQYALWPGRGQAKKRCINGKMSIFLSKFEEMPNFVWIVENNVATVEEMNKKGHRKF